MTVSTNTAKLVQIGQRVECTLPHAGTGIIFAIKGAQVPESCRSIGGVGVTGGIAEFSIVFHSGSISADVPEALARCSSQWRIHDDVASADEIESALAFAKATKEAKQAEADKKKREFENEVARLQSSSDYLHLTKGEDLYSAALAVKNIRATLKRAFPGVKFSVRKPHYGSVAIGWTDGPTQAQGDTATQIFKSSYYCGYQDMRVTEPSPWNHVFGGADHISTNRENSPELIERAITALFNEYSGNLRGIERPTAADFKAGSTFTTIVPGLGESLQGMIWKTLYSTIG